MCQPIRSVSATDFYECQGNPWNHTADSGRGRATHMISNIKKIKQILRRVTLSQVRRLYHFHWGITPERHQLSDIGYPLK
jgi:hypothetical protein